VQRRIDPRRVFDHVFETEDEPLQQPLPFAYPDIHAVPPVANGNGYANGNGHGHTNGNGHASAPVAAPAPITEEVEEVAPQPSVEAGDAPEYLPLQENVSQAVAMMLNDLKRGIKEHDWVDYALNKWDEEFLQQIAGAADDVARIGLIRGYADPELFDQLYALLLSNNQKYASFILNLQDLVKEVLNPEPENAAT
jgi:hypothetical protein